MTPGPKKEWQEPAGQGMINIKGPVTHSPNTMDTEIACGHRREMVSMEPKRRVPGCPEPGHRAQVTGGHSVGWA